MNLFQKGQKTIDKLKELLEQRKVQFEDIGREHTIKNDFISKKLNFDDSSTACFVRFQPDLLLYTDKAILLEVKTGATIGKKCFDHYLMLEEKIEDFEILICFYFQDNFYFCKPSEVPFYEYPSTAGLMYHKKAGVHIPVEGVWIFPRRMNEEDKTKFKNTMKCSGTAFAHIDINKLKQLKKL